MNTLSAFESWALRVVGGLLSGRGKHASLLVMSYHRVLRDSDPVLPGEPDAATFAAQMDLISSNFNVLPLREAVGLLRRGTLPRRAICITFDDGYANNSEIALPILERKGIPATVFVAPGFLNGGRMFNDTIIAAVSRCSLPQLDLSVEGLGVHDLSTAGSRIAAINQIVGSIKYLAPAERVRSAQLVTDKAQVAPSSGLMMSETQVLRLHRSGVEIGAHTMTHPILASIDVPTARSEIVQSRRLLEEITGAPVRSFAYPNGKPTRDYSRSHVTLVREAGFELALSTSWGAATAGSDPYQIPRIAPWDRTAGRYGLRMITAYRRRRYETA